MSLDESSKTSRRRFLFMLGVGAGTIAAADTLFAKQFAREAMPFRLPAMVYDPDLQVMVDPETRQPLYVRAEMIAAQGKDQDQKKEDQDKQDKKADQNKSSDQDKKADQTKMEDKDKKQEPKPLPTVTAGCDKCPKCDDNCG